MYKVVAIIIDKVSFFAPAFKLPLSFWAVKNTSKKYDKQLTSAVKVV